MKALFTFLFALFVFCSANEAAADYLVVDQSGDIVAEFLDDDFDFLVTGCSASTRNGCDCSASGTNASCSRGNNGRTATCSDSTGTTTCEDGQNGNCTCTTKAAPTTVPSSGSPLPTH